MDSNYDLTNPEGRLKFVVDTWPGTAGLAYAGYKAYSRGAIVFAPGVDRPMYVPLKGNNYGNKEIEKVVREYNPEIEIVVIFFLFGEQVISERFTVPSLPPPAAFRTFSHLR